jgi:hypothetical protein
MLDQALVVLASAFGAAVASAVGTEVWSGPASSTSAAPRARGMAPRRWRPHWSSQRAPLRSEARVPLLAVWPATPFARAFRHTAARSRPDAAVRQPLPEFAVCLPLLFARETGGGTPSTA